MVIGAAYGGGDGIRIARGRRHTGSRVRLHSGAREPGKVLCRQERGEDTSTDQESDRPREHRSRPASEFEKRKIRPGGGTATESLPLSCHMHLKGFVLGSESDK